MLHRIVLFPHGLEMSGVSIYCAELAIQLDKLGHKVLIATLSDGIWGDYLRKHNIPVKVLSQQEELEQVAVEFNADILHGNTCCGGSYACSVARKLGIVGGETIHSCVPGANPEADFEIATSKILEGIRPKCTTIYNAINPDRVAITIDKATMRRHLGIPEDAFVIGRNGRIDHSKLPVVFIDVLSRIPDAYGILSGDGPHYDDMIGLSERFGVSDRIRLPGLVYNVGNIINAMDVFVYPTADELSCASILEAALVVVPVVCYIRGGMGEIIVHGSTGLVANSVEELVKHVNDIRADPELGHKLATAAKELVLSKGINNLERFAVEHLQVYEKAIEASKQS
jgi:glycosyltransferase involved in cell wall biosynthesis